MKVKISQLDSPYSYNSFNAYDITEKIKKERREEYAKIKEILESQGHVVMDVDYLKKPDEPCTILIKSPILRERYISTRLFEMALEIKCISEADAVYFPNGWLYSKSCLIDYMIADSFGKEIIFEEVKDDE